MKLLKLVAINLLVTLLLVELVAAVVAYVRYRETYWNLAAARSSAAALVPQFVLDRVAPHEPDPAIVDQFALRAPRRVHPYFSFTYDPDVMPANNFGFLDVDLPYRPQPREFVVGIFGGSFAQHLGDEEPRAILAQGIQDWVDSKGYTSVRILNLAIGGWRMPSTMFAYYYFLGSFHMAIVVDGFNETQSLPRGSIVPRSYRAFDFPTPQIWEFLLSRTVGSGGGLDHLRLRIAELRKRQEESLSWVARSPWRYSMLAHLVWRSRNGALEEEIQVVSKQILEDTTRASRYATVQRGDRDVVGEFFDTYGDRLRLMASAAESEGKIFSHFVQPNQYLQGSKEYSREEERLALRQAALIGERVNRYYGRLIEMSTDLRSQGVFSSSHLLYAFKNNSETLYNDSCCHMNTRGYSLVAEEIVSRIRGSRLHARVPDAAR